jgi:hypothetical protein
MKMANNVTSTPALEAVDDPDKDEYFYSFKKRIYQSAKEGYSLNLQVLISRLPTEVRNVLVNQASDLIARAYPSLDVENGKFFSESSSVGFERKTQFSPRLSARLAIRRSEEKRNLKVLYKTRRECSRSRIPTGL